jgi:hypothetical protein
MERVAGMKNTASFKVRLPKKTLTKLQKAAKAWGYKSVGEYLKGTLAAKGLPLF